ncbi:MAG: ABC transporter substrate-binding protein, partial [Bdellovibrionales bacterium]
LYNFDRIIIDYYFDQAVVFEAFKRGIIDMFWEDRAIRWLQEYDFPAAREDRVRKLEVAKPARAQGTEGIVFNLRQPLFKRYEVRRAFTILFDFERYNRDYLVGQATPARSYFAGSFEQQATGLPSPDELRLLEPYRHLLPPEVFTAEYQVPKGNTRDRIRRALDLFKEAGYFVETSPESPYRMKVIDPDTRRPVRLEFLSRRRSEERLFLFYANMLNRAGIEASVRTVDSSQFTKRIEYRDFDAYLGGAFGYESPGNEQLNLLGSAGASEPGSWNTPGVAHPAIDGLVRKIIEAQTRSEVVTVSRALDRVMMWGQFYGPQWTFDRSYFAYWNRFGYMESQERPGTSAVISWWEKSPIAEASMQP